MKKQVIRVLCLVLCLMFACSIPFASAAEKMPTGIISCFDLETDYMARTILNQIKPTGSHKEKIRAVYDWIIRNCDRQGSESTHPAKFTDAQITKGATAKEKAFWILRAKPPVQNLPKCSPFLIRNIKRKVHDC